MNQMSLFGDNDAENQLNDGADFFFSDVDTAAESIEHSEGASNSGSNQRTGYGYSGRRHTVNRYVPDESMDRNISHVDEIKRENELTKERRYQERNNAYKDRMQYRKEYRRPAYRYRSSPANQLHRTPAPHFTKEQNVNFATSLIGLALVFLLIVFVCRGDSAFAGVTSVIIIMYVLNFLTKNKKGPGGK